MSGRPGDPARDRELALALALAPALADLARPIILGHFRQALAVDRKADLSPVTIADRAAEAAMRRLIGERFPAHGILGEEHGTERPDAEFVWVLDPIDGTKQFITGKPLFGTLIALAHQGRPVLGVIDIPALDERWIGADDRPATLNGRPVRARPCPELGEAMLYSTSPQMFVGPDADAFARLVPAVRHALFGSDCYAYGQVASGCADLVVEASLKPYDYCAPAAVIRAAGGVMTDWRGDPPGLAGDGRIVACGDPRLLGPVLDRLSATE